jgi:hypothetical protein
MPHSLILKAALKRGALVAAANWQVTLIQATADSILKLLLAVPIVGGVFLVALVLGTAPGALIMLDWREMAPTIVTALLSRPVVLAMFLLAVAVVGVGGSMFVFLVKAGTVAVLARSERDAGALEHEPLHVDTLARSSRFSVDFFLAAAHENFPAYARLGMLLMLVYLASAGGYLFLVNLGRVVGSGVAVAVVVTVAFVAWITAVNLLYLLGQIVIAAEGCGVSAATRRVATFLRRDGSMVWRIFLVVLAIVVAATGASLVAAAALSLIWFVPFVGVAVLPLQLAAGLLRALVFQYIGLTSIGAYLTVYRGFAGAVTADRVNVAPYGGLPTPLSQP